MKVLVLCLFFCATCTAQEMKLVQENPDGSKRITIDGITYLAITGKQSDDWQKLQNNYETCQKVQSELQWQIVKYQHETELLKKDVSLATLQAQSLQKDFDRAQEDAKRNYGLFIGERTLRQEAAQFIPHGNIGGVGGKLLKFLDSGYGQSLFKMVIPAATGLRAYTKQCQ